MQKLIQRIKDEGYDANLGHAVAASTGYFSAEVITDAKKVYTVQEVEGFMEFLLSVRTNELNSEANAAIQMLVELEAELESTGGGT